MSGNERRVHPVEDVRMSHDGRGSIELDERIGEYAYMPAKTPAQRQAERKARELAAGRVQWKRWVHPDDVPALAELADKLAKKRAKQKGLQSP